MNDELYQGIINALTANTSISAVIGTGINARIFRQSAPEGTAYPYCYIALARPGSDVRYYGLSGRDRLVYVAVGFVARNDSPTADRDVVLLDKYADAALTNNVTATGLIRLLRVSDVPDGPQADLAQGTIEYQSAGGIYEAYFQL